MSKYLDPKVDLTFKKVFGEHPNLIQSLLNSLLPLPQGCYIESLEYLSPEQIPENPGKKFSIVDVKCKDNYNRYFIVEMQTYWNSAFFIRTLHNTTKIYSSQLYKSDEFKQLKSVYALCIVNDNAFPQFAHTDEYIQEYYIINKHHPEDIRDAISMIFVELPKYKPVTKGDKKLKDLWLQYFTEIDEKTVDVDPDLLNNPETSIALEIVKRSAFTDAELAAYDKSKLDEITERSALSNAREEGLEKGREEGEKIGIEKGREEGEKIGIEKGREEERSKAYQEKLKMAKSLKHSGVAISIISSATGLTVDEIEKIK